MTNTETLYCEVCKDYFQRPLSRGRKPRFCPEHVPVKLTPEPVRTLYCQAGEHEWQWETKRGRAPQNCPKHRVLIEEHRRAALSQSKPEKPQMRIAHCERGDHDWELPRKPGSAPKNCPDHPAPPPKLRMLSEAPHMKEFYEWLKREHEMYERFRNAPSHEHRLDWYEVLKSCPMQFPTSRY